MNRKWILATGLSGLVVVGSRGTPSLADDWPQFRHDSRRSGLSADRLEPPLTDVWTFSGALTGRTTGAWQPASAVVWQGRVYCIAGNKGTRYLCCLDERTGSMTWRQPLMGAEPFLTDDPGCAVSPSGLVYVFDADQRDHTFRYVTQPARVENGRKVPERFEVVRHRHHYIRVYAALDGRAIGAYPPIGTEVEPGYPTLLHDGANAPAFVGGVDAGLYESLGAPLLIGDSVAATGHRGMVVRWVPGEPARYLLVAHLPPDLLSDAPMFRDPDFGGFLRRVFNPLGLDASGFPSCGFGGYPPVGTAEGVLVGGNTASLPAPLAAQRSLVMLNGAGEVSWHREFPWELGTTAAGTRSIFTLFSGSQVLGALDLSTGISRWNYAPMGLPVPKVVTIQTGGSFYAGSGHSGKWRFIQGTTNARVPVPQSPWSNNELVVTDNLVCGGICRRIAALDTQTGLPRWQCPLPGDFTVRSVAANATHLFVSCRRTGTAQSRSVADLALMSLRRDNGKVEWYRQISTVGEIALSDGLLFLADGNLHMFAPAERTFHLATDSNDAKDYRTIAESGPTDGSLTDPATQAARPSPAADTHSAPDAAPAFPERTPPEELAMPASLKPEEAMADASVVRLHWGQPVPEMLEQAKKRRALLPNAPLLISMDWLDATRASRTGEESGRWSDAQIHRFASACEQIAQASTPEYFDVGPEINVYLLRDPRQVDRVRQLIRAARTAIRTVSAKTSVLVTVNVETLTNRYGHRETVPFGHFPYPAEAEQRRILSILDEVDAVGLSSRPQTVFRSAREIPGDYLLALRPQLGRKPLLVTCLHVDLVREGPTDLQQQALFVKRLLQACYWLDAWIVSYPDAISRSGSGTTPPTPDAALRGVDRDRPALLVWQDALHWRRVPQLSCAAADRGRDREPGGKR